MAIRHLLTASLFALSLSPAYAQSSDSITVHFDLNQSLLRREDQTTLDRRFDSSKKTIHSIELAGYCDSIGDNPYNDSLARQRVAVVKEYLMSKGIARTHFIELYSYGKRNPLNDNGDEEKRSQNRRVTINWRLAEDPASGPSQGKPFGIRWVLLAERFFSHTCSFMMTCIDRCPVRCPPCKNYLIS